MIILGNKILFQNVIVFAILLCSLWCFGQTRTFQLKIFNQDSIPLNGSVLLKKNKDSNIIREFFTFRSGKISFQPNGEYQEIILEIQSPGYESYSEIINPSSDPEVIKRVIQLFKNKITELEEVVVQGKKRPFQIKKDTVIYTVDAYKDGTERKVEDLLKNLPGIEVDSKTGTVKYNGKSVETVMLEGDNLFGYNYTLGTKNINIDIVKSVEAIENYSENKLLKGIESSEKVALNLKLKSGKTDFSGSIDANQGYSDNLEVRSDASINILGINKTFKSFGGSAFNNVGKNISPVVYNTGMDNLELLREFNYLGKKIIPEFSISNSFDETRTNINKQFFSNYNSIFNFNRAFKAKINLYYLSDSLDNFENTINDYQINGQNFQTFDNKLIKRKPSNFRGDIKFDYSLSETDLLEYSLSIRDANKNIESIINSNINPKIIVFQNSENIFLKQKLLFTKKLSNRKAFQVDVLSSSNSIAQKLEISPSQFGGGSNTQNVSLEKNYFRIKSTLLGAFGEKRYKVSLGFIGNEEPLVTLLKSNNSNSSLQSEINNMVYNTNEIYLSADNSFNINKFSMKPSLKIRHFHQALHNLNQTDLEGPNQIIFEPSLSLTYKLSRNSLVRTDFLLNKNNFGVDRFFTNDILLNQRTITNNIPDLRLQKNQSLSFSFVENDLFNQLQIDTGVQYLNQNGGFFANSKINEAINRTAYFYLPVDTKTKNFHFNITKYVPFLNSTIKSRTFYSFGNYKNIVNDSDLRNNKTQFLNSELFIKSSFDTNLNFENEIIYNSNTTIGDFKFNNVNLQNKFKLIFTPTKDLFATFSMDHFIPDLNNQSKSLMFLDTTVSYFLKKNLELKVNGKNLTNENIFSVIQNSDTSSNKNTMWLLPRYFLLGLDWSF